MTADEIEALFARADGRYGFARWRRPLAPVVFGVDDATLATVKGAIAAVAAAARHPVVETDPEMGANLMVFFCRDWAELAGVPDLDRLVPGLAATGKRLEREGADQYWHYRFEADGAIRACFAFFRMKGRAADRAAGELALELAARASLLWADGALGRLRAWRDTPEGPVLSPDVAALIRAAYDPVLPDATDDASHALRLAARLARETGGR